MGTITLTLPSSGTVITAGLHSTNYSTIQTLVNGNIDNNNISASAGILWTKLSPKITYSLLSGGPPGSPADGDIWIALAVDTANLATTNGTAWMFRYNASSGSSFKWEFIGGPNMIVDVPSNESTASTSYGDLTTAMNASTASLRSGDYEIGWGCQCYNSGANFCSMGLFINGALNEGIDLSMEAANSQRHIVRNKRLNGYTAAQAIGARFKVTAGTGNFLDRWLTVRPVRIS